jgi:hypothetical protein
MMMPLKSIFNKIYSRRKNPFENFQTVFLTTVTKISILICLIEIILFNKTL